ncbi:transcription factor IIIB 70 kDa subunit-like isoform X2 [Benincasa hispida]|uniref:transcription factor IIIB 70 kDa subunit-like isoform X2 n=1 Tax=Benincasa hispida TaxID=102211 RepID=UPI0019017349|nr:transcription factor IIIB 70 kDa subunit-like isoform X2 [Benincasa hispida]
MVWCSNCVKNVAGSRDETGFLYCDMCGKVLDFYNFSQDPTFTKDAGGQSQLSGNFVRSIQSNFSASRERTLNKAFEDMRYMRNGLNMGESDEIIRVAGAFYRIALERNFTRGRNTEFVQAACLYIACREKNKPYLLIDFSNYLRINVYVLGAVFLQLCKVLRLEEHPIVQKPVDPSLFIDKFTQCLLGGTKDDGMKKEVSRTALKIITSMKRDWMQTGRKPSGLCGAALYISALSNGVKCSKSDIIKIVHICDATLTKRLIEFENTESGSLTMEEFIVMADKIKGSNSYTHNGLNATSDEVLCVHKNECKKPYALGLCKSCYDDFVELSGGLDGGSNPPAFQCAEKERTEKSMVEEGSDDSSAIGKFFQGLNPCTNTEKGSDNVHADASKTVSSKEAEAKDEQRGLDDGATKAGADGPGTSASDESENWSDIDDIEVDGYLHNEEEKHYKKIIWEEMNREYLEEQAAKDAAAAAAKKAYEANFQNCSEDLKAAKDLADAAAAAVAKSRKERQRKRAAEAKNASPAQTAAEATRQMLNKKRLSSKINYDVLDKLFDESAGTEPSTKKKREEQAEETDKPQNTTKEFEPTEDQDDDDDGDGTYDSGLYYENMEEYNYEQDYGYDEYD